MLLSFTFYLINSPSYLRVNFPQKPGNSQSLREATFSDFSSRSDTWMDGGAVFYHHALFLYHVHLPERKENFFAHLVTIFLILSSKVTLIIVLLKNPFPGVRKLLVEDEISSASASDL